MKKIKIYTLLMMLLLTLISCGTTKKVTNGPTVGEAVSDNTLITNENQGEGPIIISEK